MTSDQDTKVVAEPQVQQVQEAKENSHLVSFYQHVMNDLSGFLTVLLTTHVRFVLQSS